jgi:hypothetical protein
MKDTAVILGHVTQQHVTQQHVTQQHVTQQHVTQQVAQRRLGRVFVATLSLAALALLVGCGPVQSTGRISEAKVDFERARVAKAHEKAPYEYYSAKYYLHKAEEEWGYSDFEAAYDYALKAKKAARSARMKAKEDPWEGSPVKKAEGSDADGAEAPLEAEPPETDTEAGPRGF